MQMKSCASGSWEHLTTGVKLLFHQPSLMCTIISSILNHQVGGIVLIKELNGTKLVWETGITQLVSTFPATYKNWKSIIIFMRAHNLSLS
jgi:hypothetical protein